VAEAGDEPGGAAIGRLTGELRVATIERDDLAGVVAIHARAFPDTAITAFGPEAIRRYYLWLLDGPHDAALMGAWQGGALVGFCAAGVFRGAMNGFLRANRWYLAAHVARHPRLALSPLIRDRILTALKITLRFSRLAQAVPAGPAPSPSFGVLAIATDPQVRGTGAGRALMAEAETRARQLGHTRMTLTVHPDNARAIRFYEQLGWARAAEVPWTGTMVRAL
jgi:ribosomal protein S18 acetylase RimI-like enzyme